MCERSKVTPAVGRIFPDLSATEGELGLAFLRRGRVLRQKLHNVRVVLVAANAAFVYDVHDAGEHVTRAAADSAGTWRP